MPAKAKAARKRAAPRARKKPRPKPAPKSRPKSSHKSRLTARQKIRRKRRRKSQPMRARRGDAAARRDRELKTLRAFTAELLSLLRDVHAALSEPVIVTRLRNAAGKAEQS